MLLGSCCGHCFCFRSRPFDVQWLCFRFRSLSFNGLAFDPALLRSMVSLSVPLFGVQGICFQPRSYFLSLAHKSYTLIPEENQRENPTHGPPKIYLAQNSYPRIPEERPSTQFTPTNSRRKTKHNKSTHEFSKENLAHKKNQKKH